LYLSGVYILENTFPLGGEGKISADVIWGEKNCENDEKKGENVKQKGRQEKENEKRGSKRVK
jgi:hypothetical protein